MPECCSIEAANSGFPAKPSSSVLNSLAAGRYQRLRLPGFFEEHQATDMLRAAPNAEGITIKGSKRSSGKLFIPDLVFKQHIEMGENLFLYLGEMSECYVIYYPQQPVCTEE